MWTKNKSIYFDRCITPIQSIVPRMCIPETSYDVFIEALEILIRLDAAWVPKKRGTALYIRPFIFANENYLPREYPRHMLTI